MATETTDVRSNPREQIHHAATAIGKSNDRRLVFEAICFGKKKIKPISEIESRTGLSHKRILEEGAKLHNARLIKKTKTKIGEMAYEKDDFLSSKLDLIMKLAGDAKALETFPTKSNPIPSQTIINFSGPNEFFDAKHLVIDMIDSFEKVKDIPLADGRQYAPVDEMLFKQGLQHIMGEEGAFTDWGGEDNDLFSTRAIFNGQRANIAFCLKGKATHGILVPSKMGKNGDQILRLFRAPAEIFMVQYWGQIHQAILETMKMHAENKSLYVFPRRPIYYGIIDGQDTQRLISAYPLHFQAQTETAVGESWRSAE